MFEYDRWSIKDFEAAQALADQANATEDGSTYVPVDHGRNVSPRFGITALPQVGDKVSYAFNGDYYPDGEIVAVSATGKKVTTSTGATYFRRKQTGSWKKKGGTWSLVQGHHDRRNPHF